LSSNASLQWLLLVWEFRALPILPGESGSEPSRLSATTSAVRVRSHRQAKSYFYQNLIDECLQISSRRLKSFTILSCDTGFNEPRLRNCVVVSIRGSRHFASFVSSPNLVVRPGCAMRSSCQAVFVFFIEIRIAWVRIFVVRPLARTRRPLCYEFNMTPIVRGTTGAMDIKVAPAD